MAVDQIEHRLIPSDEVHGALRPNFLNRAARIADPTSYDAVQIGSLAYQQDSANLYRLASLTPTTWEILATGIALDTVDPGVTDDIDDGYEIGQIWVNTVSDTFFVCVDNAVGAAAWSSGGGGGGSQTLQQVYDTGANADVALTANRPVTLSRAAGGGGWVEMSKTGTAVGVPLNILHSSTDFSSPMLRLQNTAGGVTMLRLEKSPGLAGNSLEINHQGTGDAINVALTNASGQGLVVSETSTGTASMLSLTRATLATGAAIEVVDPGEGPGLRIGASSSTRGQISLNGATGDPTTTTEGDLWYNAADDALKYYDGAAERTVVAANATGDVTLTGDLTLAVGERLILDPSGTALTVPSVNGRWQLGSAGTPNIAFNGSSMLVRNSIITNTDTGVNLGGANANRFAQINASQRFRCAPLNGYTPADPLLEIANGAHTGLAADTEWNAVLFDLTDTVQFTAGGGVFSNQRAVYVIAPTYSSTAAETIEQSATVAISGAPTAGANMTITNARAFHVEGGAALFDGDLEHDGTNFGLFGSSAAQQTVTGSRAGNVALANLLNALSNYGIVIDSTSA